MDTISQDNNGPSNYLPVAALIIGLVAGVLAGVALAKAAAANRQLEAQGALGSRIDNLETQVRSAVTASEQASQRITKVASDTNNAFNQVGEVINSLRNDLQKTQEPRPAPTAAAKSSAPAPAAGGSGEYVVRSGDTGSRIARANNIALQDLMAANPGVDWNRLHVGQRLNLPQR